MKKRVLPKETAHYGESMELVLHLLGAGLWYSSRRLLHWLGRSSLTESLVVDLRVCVQRLNRRYGGLAAIAYQGRSLSGTLRPPKSCTLAALHYAHGPAQNLTVT